MSTDSERVRQIEKAVNDTNKAAGAYPGVFRIPGINPGPLEPEKKTVKKKGAPKPKTG